MALFGRVSARLTDYRDEQSFAARLRRKRAGPLVAMIEKVSALEGAVNIVDVGGTPEYWSIIPHELMERHHVTVTIINLPGAPMLVVEPPFEYREGDGCDLQDIPDGTFHIAHSNSTLEHVGDWHRMTAFAREIQRVASRGFVQTPNFWFPIEPHCMTPMFHWLPKATRVWLVRHLQLGNWSQAMSVDQAVRMVESARLLNRTMLQALFPHWRILTEWLAGLPKSLIAVKD